MNTGWVKLFRSITEWEWWGDHKTTVMFLYLLVSANSKDTKWRGIAIPRGSLVTGRKKLADETMMSEREVRTALEHLEKTQNVTIKTTKQYSIITVCKYEEYQAVMVDERPTERPTNDQQTTNNVEKEKKIPPTPPIKENKKREQEEKKKENIHVVDSARAREEELAMGGVIGDVEKLAEEFKEEIRNGSTVTESAMRLYGIAPEGLIEYVDWFVDKLNLSGTKFKSRSDFRMHFTNWLRIQAEQKMKQQQIINNGKQYRHQQPTADLFTELAG